MCGRERSECSLLLSEDGDGAETAHCLTLHSNSHQGSQQGQGQGLLRNAASGPASGIFVAYTIQICVEPEIDFGREQLIDMAHVSIFWR